MATLFCLYLFLLSITTALTESNSTNSVHAEFDVKCEDTVLVVYFNKTALDSRPYSIKFSGTNSPECMVDNSNTTNIDKDYSEFTKSSMPSKIFIAANLTENICGIDVTSDQASIIYHATIIITYGKNPSPIIQREAYDSYHVKCLRNRTVEKALDGPFIVAPKENQINKNVSLDYKLKLVHSHLEDKPFQGFYKTGDSIKFTLSLETETDVKGAIQECRATSDQNSANLYKLIYSKCETEPGTKIIHTKKKETVFVSEAFTYISGEVAIFVECTVLVCFIKAKALCELCDERGKRKRRDVTIGDQAIEQTTVIKSPIFYVISKDPEQPSKNNNISTGSNFFSGSTGLIVIVLLAVLVLVNVIVIVKKIFFTKPLSTQSNNGHQNPAFDKI